MIAIIIGAMPHIASYPFFPLTGLTGFIGTGMGVDDLVSNDSTSQQGQNSTA